jgi:hypothetical protein
MTLLFLQIESFGAVAAAAFFLAFAVVAFIAFKMLRKTVQMAFRMIVVAVILLIAIAGGIALLMFGSGAKNSPKPASTRPR